jgi:anthranilate phosphoribosyltransferase
VALNAAAALLVGGQVEDLREGAVRAGEAMRSGAALARLEGLRAAR